jgi:hypothetical protein
MEKAVTAFEVCRFAGYGGSQGADVVPGESDIQRHQQLERLYISTRSGKVSSFLEFKLKAVTGFLHLHYDLLNVSISILDLQDFALNY